MIYISRNAHFSAAHKLNNPKWDQEKNEEMFGVCANENWHGHNFDLTVTVKGEPDPETGFVMNFTDLKQIVNREILDKVDHKNLNMDVDFLKGKMISCETLTIEFWKILDVEVRKATGDRVSLYRIKLYETPNNFAEYFGE